jgi:hypothetical protein
MLCILIVIASKSERAKIEVDLDIYLADGIDNLKRGANSAN